jgi:hypothetical protein
MRASALLALPASLVLWPSGVAAEPRFRLDGGGTFSRFEQQVKTEIGGARGERLVESMEAGFVQMLTYRVWGPLSVGHFIQFDAGTRQAGRFAGFDPDGKTIVEGNLGGAYYELWIGPLLRAEWRRLFVELGYGALGARVDEARSDLAAEGGAAAGALRTRATVAWVIGAGGGVPLAEDVELALRLEYRVRYYDRRGGKPLANGIVHGTQNFTPFAGIAWRFGPGSP